MVKDNLENLKRRGKKALMQSKFDREVKDVVFGQSDYSLAAKMKDRIYKLF